MRVKEEKERESGGRKTEVNRCRGWTEIGKRINWRRRV